MFKSYLANSKSVIKLQKNSKKPIGETWKNQNFTEEDLLNHNGNFGFEIPKSNLVLDIDPRNGGLESYKNLKQYLSLELTQTVKTPSGGFHIYLSIPEEYQNQRFPKKLQDYPGIDCLHVGHYVVIPPSKIDDKHYQFVDFNDEYSEEPIPQKLLDFLLGKKDTKLIQYSDTELTQFPKQTEDEIQKLIANLDPSCSYDIWLKIGMSIHSWDSSETGLEIWENWSKQGENYTPGATEIKWKSFGNKENKVTLGTIYHLNKIENFHNESEIVARYIRRIEHADEQTLFFEILPKLKKEPIQGFLSEEKLVKAVKDRLKAISDVTISPTEIKKMIKEENTETPLWCNNWKYIDKLEKFIDLERLYPVSIESFNLKCGKFIPQSKSGTKVSAFKFVSDNGFIEHIDSIAYLPMCEDKIVQISGESYVNCFRAHTVPQAATEYTTEGLYAINRMKKQMKLICNTDENCEIFLDWMAHQIQNPGIKILWAPVFQSIEGLGKGYFGEVLELCLGEENVGIVSPDEVSSDYKGWGYNKCVSVLNELRLKGQNRYDVINSLKPFITDKSVRINIKHVNQFKSINTTNYLCFTNYKDALPLDKSDRRWWIVFSDVESLNEIESLTGYTLDNYFPTLFDSLRENFLEIRKYLLEHKISDKFKSYKQAPLTIDKMLMISTEEDEKYPGLSEVQDLLANEPDKYCNEKYIFSQILFSTVEFENTDLKLTNWEKNSLLKRLGYNYLGRFRIDKKPHRIWVKSHRTTLEHIIEHMKTFKEKEKIEKTKLFDDFD